jgi:hypothetical protein
MTTSARAWTRGSGPAKSRGASVAEAWIVAILMLRSSTDLRANHPYRSICRYRIYFMLRIYADVLTLGTILLVEARSFGNLRARLAALRPAFARFTDTQRSGLVKTRATS